MFCPSCGNEVDDNAVFCDTCGCNLKAEQAATPAEQPAPTPEAPAADIPAPEAPAATPFYDDPANAFSADMTPAPKKKGPVKAIVGIAIVLAVLLLGFIFRGFLMDTVMLIMPADMQVKYAYAKELGVYSDVVLDLYDDVREVMVDNKQSTTGTFSVSLDGSAMKDLTDVDMPDMDLSGEYTVAKTNEAVQVDLKLKSEGEEINVKAGLDLKEGLVALDIPELCDEPMVMDLEDMGMEMDIKNPDKTLKAIVDLLPERKELEDVITNALKAALDTLDDVDKGKEEFTAGGITQTATCYTIDFSEETFVDMGKAAIDALKEDKTLKKYIISLYDAPEKLKDVDELADLIEEAFDSADIGSGDDLYDLVADGLDSVSEALDEEDPSDENLMTVRTYLGSRFDIVALEAESEGEVLLIGKATSGKEVGYEISLGDIEEDSYVFNFGGGGTESFGKFSGELVCTVNGEEILTVECTNADIDGLLETGMLNGTFAISEKVSGMNLEINITAKCSDKDASIKMETTMFDLEMKGKMKNSAKINLPDEGMDAEEWSEEADLDVLEDMFGDMIGTMGGATTQSAANAYSSYLLSRRYR